MTLEPEFSDAAAAGRSEMQAPSDLPPREMQLPRQSRRLPDRVLIAFHQACDQDQLDVGRQLLDVYEAMITRRDVPADISRRRALEALVAAHERLWNLRHQRRP